MFLTTLQNLCLEYSMFLEDVISREESKLLNLPESFMDGGIYNCINDTCESISNASEIIDEILADAAELPDVLGLQMRKARTKGFESKSVSVKANRLSNNEKRTERLQLVLTPSMMSMLKLKSSEQGISMNEMINILLLAEFSK